MSIDLTDELIQYCHDCIDGVIMSCVKHKWACMRFLSDIERQGTKDFPYVFDDNKADRFLRWMGKFSHRKGPLAGTLKIPHITEKFMFGNIYGWVHRDTNLRRFKLAYIQEARKNAKSQDEGIVGLYEMSAMGELSAEVYCAATKHEQSKIVWTEADTLYKKNPEMKEKFKTAYGEIRHIKSDSFFRAMSKDDKDSGDGLNPQCGIIDEYHAHKTDEYYEVLASGMGARKQPLMIIITTAGFELNNPCYRVEYQYVSQILDPNNPIENDQYFVDIYELDKDAEGNLIDDIIDESVWPKANPIVCLTDIGMDYLRTRLKTAQDAPEKMSKFLTKNMNVWVNQGANAFMDMAKWKLCGASKENPYPDVTGLEVIAGFDLAAVIDLASIGLEIPIDDELTAIISHSFMPESTLFTKMKSDKVPYKLWVDQGWITITPGAEIDYRFMVKWLEDYVKNHGLIVKELCFDRYMAAMLQQELSDAGYVVVDIPQGIPTLSMPTKDFRAKVYNKRFIHDNNPVLTWGISNAVTRMDHNENIMLDKSKSTERIDPIASLINAHVRVWLNEQKPQPIYEKRGMRSLL